MGLLKYIITDNASTVQVLGEAYEKMTAKAADAANAAAKKANASAAAAAAEKAVNQDLSQTLKAEAQARLKNAMDAMAAAQQKVAASRAAAKAAREEFEESYRVAQAPGGLTIDSMNQMQANRQKMKSAEMAAEADVIGLEASNAAYLSNEKKAESEIADAEALLTKTTATEQAAVADEEAAVAAIKHAEAMNAEAAAAIQSAEANKAASASQLLGIGPLGWAIIATIALGVAIWQTVKAYHEWAKEKRNMAYLMDSTSVKFDAEAKAMEKLADEARNLEKEISKLSESQLHLADSAEEAIGQLSRMNKLQMDFQNNRKEAAILDVEIAEKKGMITHEQAVKKKAEIEKKAVKDKYDLELVGLANEFKVADAAAAEAERVAEQKKKAAADAAEGLGTPEARNKLALLNSEEEKLKTFQQVAGKMQEYVLAHPEDSKAQFHQQEVKVGEETFHGSFSTWKNFAEKQHEKVESAKDGSDPVLLSAQTAITQAKEARADADKLNKKATDLAQKYTEKDFAKNAVVGDEQGIIDKKAQLELLNKSEKGGHGAALSSQQRLGAYAYKESAKQIDLLQAIKANTAHLKPPTNRPVHPHGPTHGQRQAHR